MISRGKADQDRPSPTKTCPDPETEACPPPLSDAERARLYREWTDANTRGDVPARRRVEDRILGHLEAKDRSAASGA